MKAIRRLCEDDVKLMGDVSDVMNKVFTKGEIMEGLIEELKEFQKEAQNWEQLFQNEGKLIKSTYILLTLLFNFEIMFYIRNILETFHNKSLYSMIH